MHIDRHPDPIVDRMIDEAARRITTGMTPLQLGLLLYPDATPKDLAELPEAIVTDHLTRYTRNDLETGQFLEVLPGRYTFIMSEATKKRLEMKATARGK